MKIVIRKSEWLSDWYLIERAEHNNTEWFEGDEFGSSLHCSSRLVSNASIEGTLEEMQMIAEAIFNKSKEEFKRVAADATGDMVELWSPRNSTKPGIVTYQEALDLAEQINKL